MTGSWRRAVAVLGTLVALSALLGCSGGSGPPKTTLIDAVVAAVRHDYARNQYPTTGAIVVVRIGHARRVISMGFADPDRKVRFTERTRVPAASITKLMVATTAMKLVATRRLRLDDSVERHLPGVVPGGRKISVRDLLSQRSGLRDEEHPWISPGEAWSRAALAKVLGTRPDTPPGVTTWYANLNYVTLSLVLEQVTGRPLAELLRANVFRPLGMTGSSLGTANLPGPYAHEVTDGKEGAMTDPGEYYGAGAVVSTAGDIDRFLTALSEGRLVPRRVLAQMIQPRGIFENLPGRYGLGVWHTSATECGDAWGHSGRLPGFATEAYVRAGRRRSVVVIVNGGSSREAGGPGSYLADTLVDSALCAGQ